MIRYMKREETSQCGDIYMRWTERNQVTKHLDEKLHFYPSLDCISLDIVRR